MTRYLLDTNFISDVTRPQPSPSLTDWMSRQVDEELFISTMSIAEIRRGILELPSGRKRLTLEVWFESSVGPAALFSDRVLPFDERAASIWATLMADGRATGKPRNGFDMIVAATAIANNCVIVTANERDFTGLEYLNPVVRT